MLRFVGDRFHMPGASLTIPEGFYLNSDPELVDDFGVYIVPKDRAYSVHLSFSNDGRTDEALREILGQYDEYSMIRENAAIDNNGLRGHDAIYTSSSVGYYEARFQLADQRNLLCLVTTKSAALEGILAGQEFHMVMAGIRREDDSVYYS